MFDFRQESSLAHIIFLNIFDKSGNIEIGRWFTVEFESQDLKIGIILAVLKHSVKIPSDNELWKSFDTAGKMEGLKFYI